MTQILPINNFNIPKQPLQPTKTSNTDNAKPEQKQTAANKLYHTKTHAGLLFTGILSSVFVIGVVLCNRMKLNFLELDNKAAIGIGMFSTAIGALTDFFINKTNKKFVEKNKDKTVEELFLTEKKAEPTKKQNIYYETNTGKKAGAAIGAVTGALYLPILALISGRKSVGGEGVTTTLKALFNKEELKFKLLMTLGASLIGTVSGFINGAIIDKFANIGASRKADKMAEKANNATA